MFDFGGFIDSGFFFFLDDRDVSVNGILVIDYVRERVLILWEYIDVFVEFLGLLCLKWLCFGLEGNVLFRIK